MQHVGGGVADDLRFATLGIAVVGVERVARGFDLVAFAEQLFNRAHHAGELLGILFGRIRSISCLRDDADIDLRLVGFHHNYRLAVGCNRWRSDSSIALLG